MRSGRSRSNPRSHFNLFSWINIGRIKTEQEKTSITLFSRLINRLTILPRWIIIVLDLIIIGLSIYSGYLLRFNFNFDEIATFNPILGVAFGMASALTSLLITKSYAGIVRYTGLVDGV